MTHATPRRPWLAALALAACASTPPKGSPARDALVPTTPTTWVSGMHWQADVTAIALAGDVPARREAVAKRMEALGIAVERHTFHSPTRDVIDLLGRLPDARTNLPVLLIGAHYDRVAHGEGAVDNGSGCATVLDLAGAILAHPLAHHRVVIAFWDLEEIGLVGSAAWVAQAYEANDLYLNFDVFGYGDTIWGMVPDALAPFKTALDAAGAAAGVATVLGNSYPPSDHLAFQMSGHAAVSLSLIGGAEIPSILQEFAGQTPAVKPHILEIMHTDRDVPAELDAPAVVRALPVLSDGLRRWDAAGSI